MIACECGPTAAELQGWRSEGFVASSAADKKTDWGNSNKVFMNGNQNSEKSQPFELQIDGVLDLHTFNPKEIGDLVPAYLAACQEKGILEVRIIHGKGIGNLMRSVHAILEKHPEVIRFSQASVLHGGTGATIVILRKGSAG